MRVGDRIYAPPPRSMSVSDLVEVTVERLDRHRTIRDPSDGTTRSHQWIHVRYEAGERAKFDRYFLERLQPSP